MSTFIDIRDPDFSKKCFRIWPYIRQFTESLPSKSQSQSRHIGICSNTASYRKDLTLFGMDYLGALDDICSKEYLSLHACNALCMPFSNDTFDAIVTISCVQYIEPILYSMLLKELKRVLVKGGKCLISTWAFEDNVPSKRPLRKGYNVVMDGNNHARIQCWVMDRDLAEEFVDDLPHGLELRKLELKDGHWNFLLQKTYE